MPIYNHDMGKVESWGDVAPEGWYRVRIEKGEERLSKESGQPTWAIFMKVQNEPHVGRVLFDQPSLQPHALAKLKAYYTAVGYTPGPEGHDPERLNGGELFVKIEHEMYQGEKRGKIAPYNIRSLQEGPKGTLAGAAAA
jgi:hypothetical protein